MSKFDGFDLGPKRDELLKKLGEGEDSIPGPNPESAKKSVGAKVAANGEACFPVEEEGMPVALYGIPEHERPWYWKHSRYRGYEIAFVNVQHPAHERLFRQTQHETGERWHRAFYVRASDSTIGLVPFPNSTVVWPWEAGWIQDLARDSKEKMVQDLKPSMEKKRK